MSLFTYHDWQVATSALGCVNKMLAEAEHLCAVTGGDETSVKLHAALKRVKERYAADQKKAKDENVKFAAEVIPASLRDAGQRVVALVSERLVDAKTLVHYPWVAPAFMRGEEYSFSYIIRICDERERLNADLTMLPGRPHIYAASLGSIPEVNFAEEVAKRVFDRMSGWPGLRGEKDRNIERGKLLDQISPVLQRICRQLSSWSGEIDPIGLSATSVTCGFRTHRLESLSEGDREDTIASVHKEFTTALRLALGNLVDKVSNIDCYYNEKGWYTVEVTVK